MKVLVTGASGFLGGWVAQRLLERGHQVRALVRKSSNRKHLESLEKVEFAYGAIEDGPAVLAATEGVDAIIHSAGLVKARNEAEFQLTNVQGTQFIIDAAKAHRATVKRVVIVSSLEAGGPSADGSPAPLEPEAPVTAYGRSKLAGEKVAVAAKDELHVVVLRPGAIYGPRDVEIFAAIQTVARGLKPVVAGGHAKGSFIFGRDCAEACINALDAEVASGTVLQVVDDSGALTQREFLSHVEGALGKKALIGVSLPKFVLRSVSATVGTFGKVTNRAVMLTPEKAEMLMMHWVGSPDRAKQALKWKPEMNIEAGLNHTVAWYREHGWL
jgi:nucleoside-diphosphate-sugar epimerase